MTQRIHILHIEKGGFRFQTHRRRIHSEHRHCTVASRDNELLTKSEHDPHSKITVSGCEQEAWVMTADATPPPKLGHTQTVPSTYTHYARHGDVTYQCHQLRSGCWTVLLAPRFCYLRQTRQASMRTIFKEFRNTEDISYRHFVKLDAIYITSILPVFTRRRREASIL